MCVYTWRGGNGSFFSLGSCQPERSRGALAFRLHQLSRSDSSLQILLDELWQLFTINLVIRGNIIFIPWKEEAPRSFKLLMAFPTISDVRGRTGLIPVFFVTDFVFFGSIPARFVAAAGLSAESAISFNTALSDALRMNSNLPFANALQSNWSCLRKEQTYTFQADETPTCYLTKVKTAFSCSNR